MALTRFMGFCVAVFCFSIAVAAAEPVSRQQARASLLGILADLRARSPGVVVSTPEDREFLLQAIQLERAYRSNPTPVALGTVTIAGAPFLGLLVGQKISDFYAAAYATRHAQEYDNVVVHPKLEFILDRFLEAYLAGSLPDSLKKSASGLGSCLARKAVSGKSESCYLDESTAIHKPSVLRLAAAKLGCFLPTPSVCTVRQLIFNQAKADLLRARATHALAGPFEEAFPKEFRTGLLKQLNETYFGVGSLVSRKFKGEGTELWGDHTPLVETDEADSTQVTLFGFAEGLRADLALSARLAGSDNAQERGLSSALFYASANRLLLLTGGQQAAATLKGFTLAPDDHFDSARPKASPKFLLQNFGGWGLQKAGFPDALPVFSSWDWAAYAPTDKDHPTAFRIFPSIFQVGEQGVPVKGSASVGAVETLGDLAELLGALTDFLKMTRATDVFGSHFGAAQDLNQILDPDRPVVFPQEGRLLAVGALAGVLKNLIAPGLGHIEQTLPGLPSSGLGLLFHDRVTLSGHEPGGAPTRAVANALIAASELRVALQEGLDVPAELQSFTPQLDSALQIGALTLGAQAQTADGGFNERLSLLQGASPPVGQRSLIDAVESLRALGHAYEASQILLLRLSLRLGWRHLEQFWVGDRVIPQAFEGAVAGAPGGLLNPGDLWALIQLWNESQGPVRWALASDVDWTKWDHRIIAVRHALLDHLRSGHGSEPILE